MNETPFYKHYLEQELARRCSSNPSYSLRAFARALNVDPGNFSRLIAGKAFLSGKVFERLVERLALHPEERDLFITSFIEEQKWRKLQGTRSYSNRVTKPYSANPSLEIEMFRIIGDWYHCAILELVCTENCKSDPKWIARQLGISPLEAKLAIERLLKLELLEKTKEGRLKKAQGHITTKDKHLTTPALRRLQKQLLEKATHALDNIPIEKRYQSAMSMAIDPQKLPIAKKMIEEFAQRVCQVMESGRKKKVYQLTVSLFPMQNLEES